MRSSLKITLSCFCLGLALACSKQEKTQTAPPVPEVKVLKIEARSLPLSVEFLGQTKGSIDAEIRARVDGVLQSINFEEGKAVKEGQLLYTIDPAPFVAKVNEAKAKLVEAETRLVKAQADLKRIRPLAQMNAVSKRDLDTAIANEGVARGSVDVAKAGLEAAEINSGYTKITAPVSGIIGLTKAKVGEYVGRPPSPVVLNTVSQLNPIHVRFPVNEKDYLYFRRKREAEREKGVVAAKNELRLFLADGSEHPQAGEVCSIDSQIDPNTGSLMVEASFANPNEIIRPGQFAKIKANKDTLNSALLVPAKAVRDLQGIKQVLVVTPENRIALKQVTLGEAIAGEVLINSGLEAGELVLPEAQASLAVGSEVKPVIIN